MRGIGRSTADENARPGRMIRRQFPRGVALFILCIRAGTAATIAGAVKTSAGKPIRAAVTIHDLSSSRVAGQKAFDYQFGSKADGTFEVTGVPAGKYEFCVEAPSVNVLDPCLWPDPGAKTITVAASDAVKGYAITVKTGYKLQLRVNDPQALLPSNAHGVAGDALSLTVVSKERRFHNFRLQAVDKTGRDHYILVPFNEPVTVLTQSSKFALSDDNGSRLASDSRRLPVPAVEGAAIQPIVVNLGKR